MRRNKDASRAAAGHNWTETGFVFTTSVGTPFEPRNFNRRFEARHAQIDVTMNTNTEVSDAKTLQALRRLAKQLAP